MLKYLLNLHLRGLCLFFHNPDRHHASWPSDRLVNVLASDLNKVLVDPKKDPQLLAYQKLMEENPKPSIRQYQAFLQSVIAEVSEILNPDKPHELNCSHCGSLFAAALAINDMLVLLAELQQAYHAIEKILKTGKTDPGKIVQQWIRRSKQTSQLPPEEEMAFVSDYLEAVSHFCKIYDQAYAK